MLGENLLVIRIVGIDDEGRVIHEFAEILEGLEDVRILPVHSLIAALAFEPIGLAFRIVFVEVAL